MTQATSAVAKQLIRQELIANATWNAVEPDSGNSLQVRGKFVGCSRLPRCDEVDSLPVVAPIDAEVLSVDGEYLTTPV